MDLYVGTSGYSYPEWVGPFYPKELKKGDWLAFYAERLSAVEINNSFYRVPQTSVVEKWAESVPKDFRFVLKVTRRVTHFSRLKETAEEPMQWMWTAAQSLGARRGPLLFQLPPNFKADVERLRAFLGGLDDDARPAFEFRNSSWNTDEITSILGEHGACLVVADTGDSDPPPIVATAPFGYLRLRRPSYTAEELDAWVAAIRETGWKEVHVFFKHEDAGAGPAFAADFRARFEAAEGS